MRGGVSAGQSVVPLAVAGGVGLGVGGVYGAAALLQRARQRARQPVRRRPPRGLRLARAAGRHLRTVIILLYIGKGYSILLYINFLMRLFRTFVAPKKF